jgi:hypothetical protein
MDNPTDGILMVAEVIDDIGGMSYAKHLKLLGYLADDEKSIEYLLKVIESLRGRITQQVHVNAQIYM